MGRGKEKAPHQAATRGGGFTGLPHTVQDSEAYRTLDMFSRAVLLAVVRRFNGRNNGEIFVSFDEISHDLNTTNRRAIGRSFTQLVDRGLLDVTAAPDRLHHKAREYRLTWINTTAGGRHVQATEEYRLWNPHVAQNHSDEASPTGVSHGDAVLPSRPILGDAALLRIAKSRGKSVEPVLVHGDAASLHVISHTRPAKQTDSPPCVAPPTKSAGSLLQCERCGDPITFEKPARGKPKRFCSERCRKADEARRARERKRGLVEPHLRAVA